MPSYRRNVEASQRAADRRRRENDADRLLNRIPRLNTLRLELEEQTAGGRIVGTAHIRRIVTETAPALFALPCGDPRCNGSHDLTREIMTALLGGTAQISGQDPCSGDAGSVPCPRILHYTVLATYS